MAAYQAPPSLGFSRKNTGVGCHFLLQCMKVKSESEVTQSCRTLSDPMDCSLPGSSVHGFSRQEYWSGVPLPSPSFLQLPYQGFLPLVLNKFSHLFEYLLINDFIPSFSFVLIVPNLGLFSLSLNYHLRSFFCLISSVMPPLWSQFLYQILHFSYTV